VENQTLEDTMNFFAVGVSAVASFVTGWVWFMVLFREPYIRGLDKTAEELAKGPTAVPSLLLQFVGNLVMALVLGWLVVRLNSQTALQGMRVGALAWLGFIAAVLGPYYAFQAYPFSFFLINAGYPLVSLLMMGAILGAWR
jgi:hypothetical protein